MHIESQGEKARNSSEKLIFGIQYELIVESCGKDKMKINKWIEEHSPRFRKIIEENPELVWEYPATKNEIKGLLYGETIH